MDMDMDTMVRRAGGRFRVVAVGGLVLTVASVLGACTSGSEPASEPTVVTEVPPSAAQLAARAKAEKFRLGGERRFTYADSAYGKCLISHGVAKLPPIDKPLVLSTSDPTAVAAVKACVSLAPVPSPSAKP
jgi:hypothetical protein